MGHVASTFAERNGYADDGDVPYMNETDKRNALVKLEKAVDRMFIGAFEVVDDGFACRTKVISDAAEWQYIVLIDYSLKGEHRKIEHTIDIHNIESPKDMMERVRQAIIEDISNVITKQLFDENQKPLINAARHARES